MSAHRALKAHSVAWSASALVFVGTGLAPPISAAPKARVYHRTLPVAAVGTVTYAIAVPNDSRTGGAMRPLVMALHPGGVRIAYRGSRFMQQVVLPALGDLHAIIVAPDCPTPSWAEPTADQAVMAVMKEVRSEFTIDSRRIIVTGFSLGGRGTWFFAAHHADLFTGAIPMAAPLGDERRDLLGLIPTYIIHSRDDEIVPFEPAQRTARELASQGRDVRFEELRGLGHFEMGGYVTALRRAGQWITERWNKLD